MNKNNKNLSSSEIKLLYNNNSSKNKSNYSIYNQDESNCSKKYLIKEKLFNNSSKNKNNILNIKKEQRTIKNNQDNLYDNIILYYKNLNKDKNNYLRKSLDSNYSAPSIYLYSNHKNSSNISRKKFILNYLKKIHNDNNLSGGKNLSSKKDLEPNLKDNSFNNTIKNNNNSKNILKKLTLNAANNTFNNKNNTNLSLNTSIFGDKINIEKFKVQQKMPDYRKLFDKKINKLINEKIRKNKNYEIENRMNYSPKNKLEKKCSNSNSVSVLGRNKKAIINSKFNNTNYKNIYNEKIKNIPEKITIIPKKIINYEHRSSCNSLTNSKSKLKKLVNNGNIQGKIYLNSYNEMMNKKTIF